MPYTLRYGIFHEIFEDGIYIQKVWHFSLRDVFISRKLDTSQKARQFAIRFYAKKSGTLRYAIFHWICEICRRGEAFIHFKKMRFAWHFYIEKRCTLCYVANARMISTAIFSVHILLLHHYRSNLAHISDSYSSVIVLYLSEMRAKNN